MKPTRITLVPHTHWDREWYEPFDVFRERLVSMMDALLELGVRGFPHFHLDGQTAMIDDYLAVRPDREPELRRLATEGRLSVGPWVTQMDEFLTSGESHIRNLEMGLARAEELGPATHIGYLPDQFGHIGQMPQILRNTGIERAVVWRGVPGAVDRTAFFWESPDGSRVSTEYLAFGYSLGADIHRYSEPVELARALQHKVETMTPFLASDRMLVTVGSDHTGPDATLPERLERAERHLPGLRVRIGSLGDHLDGPEPEDVPVVRGELRSSSRAHLLPNVYSARANQKRERGRVEALVERYAEPLAALVPGFAWPSDRLERAWTLLLWNGAHDSVCGCSHDRVARDVDARYAEVRSIAEAIVGEALDALGSQISTGGMLRFNPSPFELEGVPGLGWRVDPDAVAEPSSPVTVAIRDGWIEAGHLAFSLRDEPDIGDLYNFCYERPNQAAAPPDRLELRGGDVVAKWEGLEVRLRVRRRPDDPFVRVEGTIANRRPDHRLRLHVRLPDEALGSLAGSPFELTERGLVSEGSDVEAPSPTWPARGVVLAGGVACYHEGVFEYEVAGDELAVTLLRAVGTISRDRIATRPWPAGPGVATPDAQMIGTTAFAIGIGTPATRKDVLPAWERFALPLIETRTRGDGRLPASGRLLVIEGGAALSSVRRRRDQLEVRLWNPAADRSVIARVGARDVELAPARIETLALT